MAYRFVDIHFALQFIEREQHGSQRTLRELGFRTRRASNPAQFSAGVSFALTAAITAVERERRGGIGPQGCGILKLKAAIMIMPAVIAMDPQIKAAIGEVVYLLAPDVVYIRYEIGKDWSGDWAIFFRVVLSDEASKKRLREVATNVVCRLAERLDFPSMGVFPYHNFRSVSEQEAIREEAWA